MDPNVACFIANIVPDIDRVAFSLVLFVRLVLVRSLGFRSQQGLDGNREERRVAALLVF